MLRALLFPPIFFCLALGGGTPFARSFSVSYNVLSSPPVSPFGLFSDPPPCKVFLENSFLFGSLVPISIFSKSSLIFRPLFRVGLQPQSRTCCRPSPHIAELFSGKSPSPYLRSTTPVCVRMSSSLIFNHSRLFSPKSVVRAGFSLF